MPFSGSLLYAIGALSDRYRSRFGYHACDSSSEPAQRAAKIRTITAGFSRTSMPVMLPENKVNEWITPGNNPAQTIQTCLTRVRWEQAV